MRGMTLAHLGNQTWRRRAAQLAMAVAIGFVLRPWPARACIGDCRGLGTVSISDLILGVDIVLGLHPVSVCPAFANEECVVDVAQVVQGVNNALNGCAPLPTVTAAPSGVPATATVAVTAQPSATPPATVLDRTNTATTTPVQSATVVLSATPSLSTPPPVTPTNTPVPTGAHFCDLPGSYQTTMPGISVVPGGPKDAPDLSFLNLPVGFCAHYYAHVGTNDSCCLGPVRAPARGDVRQLRFAPGGELFITSPTAGTTGGCGCAGKAAILVLPDDDHDGMADGASVFLDSLPKTQGLLFANGYLYYQDDSKIMRLPYAPGDRAPSGTAEQVADIFAVTQYYSSTHWPKTLDMADDGTIYVTAGGDESEHPGDQPPQCALASKDRPFHGGILKLDESANGGATPVAKGFRNPISVRCARNRGQCFAVELALDYSYDKGGREKLVPIRQGDDWGYPCCATQNLAYSDYTNPVPDCSGVAPELGSFYIGHTPFGVDFETGKWPDPWKNSAYVVLHGEYGDWSGEGIIAIDYDAMTGNFLPGSDLSGMLSGSFREFASGWELPLRGHGRPANVAFAPDGRLFVGNDVTGDIFWIAPLDLQSHS